MNRNFLEGETHTTHRERLIKEMEAEVVAHKQAIIQALRNSGHTIEHGDLDVNYIAQDWKVDGYDIDVRSQILYKDHGFSSEPLGTCRFTFGPYNDKRMFAQRTAAAALKKFPAGFDYKAMAEELVDLVWCGFERDTREKEARTRADENNDAADASVERLMVEFKFTSKWSSPIDHNPGNRELKLKFHGLTEDQARAILRAARDAKVFSDEVETENDDG